MLRCNHDRAVVPSSIVKEALTIRALAPRYYLDGDHHALEMDRVFARTWQYACHESEVAERNTYRTFRIGDQGLFVIRDGEGRLRAFYNVCKHRAHELLRGAGRVRLVTCPYHAWSYDPGGRLVRAPNSGKTPGFDGSKIRLTEVGLESFCGFLFVNLDPGAASMAEWYPGAEEELRAFVPGIDGLRPLLARSVEEDCNWKVSVENYSECYHCRVAHPTFTKGVVDPDDYNVTARGHCLRHSARCVSPEHMSYAIDTAPGAGDAVPGAGGTASGAEDAASGAEDTTSGTEDTASPTEDAASGMGGDACAAEYRSWFLWPAFSFQVYPGGVLNTYLWRPEGTEKVTVHRGWYTAGGVREEVVEKLAQQDLDTTVAEDVRLVNSVQRGLKSKGYAPGPLVLDPGFGVNSEHSIQALNEWLLQALDT